jgi:acetoin utilization deacetylase AcuC-like enzyme
VLIVSGPAGEHTHLTLHHPERAARITAVRHAIDDLHLGTELTVVDPAPAPRDAVERVHDAHYLDAAEAFCRNGGGHIDPDTFAGPDTWDAALLAAGAGLAAIDELERRNDGVAFVAARPPGHHALPARSMGFCILNNIAIAAASLTARGERVLIVDWDVHHGNGTQDVFYDDPNVLFVSTHQWPWYPGTGRAEEIGGRDAAGLTVNVPLPAGATGDVVRRSLDEVAMPAIDRFGPTWVLVSAGFDAHHNDPLAELELSSGDFGHLGAMVAELAPRPGRLALFLEGGYDLDALRASVADALAGTLGDTEWRQPETSNGPGADAVHAARGHRERALARIDMGEGDR